MDKTVLTMLHTIQSSYEKLRSGQVAVADSDLDGVTAGLTYKSTDRPDDSECFVAGPEVGGVTLIFDGEGSATDTFSWSLYGYRTVGPGNIGPAEIVAAGTGLLGTAVSENGFLYADTIVITNPGSWYDVPIAIDSGNNRICKLCFDLVGFKYLSIRFTAIGGTSMQCYVSYF